MALIKQDLDHIQKIVSETVNSTEIRLEKKIEEANKAQTEHLLDAIEGIVESMYSNFPTREEVKKGLKAFSGSVSLKTS